MSGFHLPQETWLFLAALASKDPTPSFLASRLPDPMPAAHTLFQWAQSQGVQAVVQSAALPMADEFWPNRPILDLMQQTRKQETVDWIRFEEGANRALGALRNALPTPPIVIKGGALRYLLYGAPWQRPCRDLDLMVPPEGLVPALAALRGMGFKMEQPAWGPLALATAVNLDHRGFRVEVHTSLFSRVRPEAGYFRLAAGAQPVPGLADCLAPDATGHFLIGVLHLVRHGFQFLLKDLADLDRLVRLGQVDWPALHESLDRLHLPGALEWTLGLLEHTMATPVVPAAWPQRRMPLGPRRLGPMLARLDRPEFWRCGRFWPLHVGGVLTLASCADSAAPLAEAAFDWTRRRLVWLRRGA